MATDFSQIKISGPTHESIVDFVIELNSLYDTALNIMDLFCVFWAAADSPNDGIQEQLMGAFRVAISAEQELACGIERLYNVARASI